ncbi:hypothetical protein, partial [Aeromonas caviae]|uniref:hypothetical protein n=1 Tax=Aeromonas caviae TaxID=648 RepID=UPI001CC6FF47
NVVSIEHGDFFRYDWVGKSSDVDGNLLVLGNLPWVTNHIVFFWNVITINFTLDGVGHPWQVPQNKQITIHI